MLILLISERPAVAAAASLHHTQNIEKNIHTGLWCVAGQLLCDTRTRLHTRTRACALLANTIRLLRIHTIYIANTPPPKTNPAVVAHQTHDTDIRVNGAPRCRTIIRTINNSTSL